MKRAGRQIVEVEWVDARSVYEQIEVEHVAEKVQLCRRHSLGYLVHRDRERIILAATFDPAEKRITQDHAPDSDGMADFTVIPRGWAQKIITLVQSPDSADKEESE